MKKIALTFLTACVGGAVAIGTYKLIEDKYEGGMSFEDRQKVYFTNNPLNIASSTGALDFTQAASAVTPAVVHIKTTYNNAQANGSRDAMEDMFRDFFGGRGRQSGPAMASGSGVIISDDGYIVTNNHVVEDADKIDVILPDKRSFSAKVIGRDPNTDLSLIKIDAKNLPIVKLGNSDNVRVGEWVLAVGYPFTLNTTVTAGIVSAKGRSIGILGQNQQQRPSADGEPLLNSAIESFIQTDAAINRGNSGGALVNTNGELIGINAAIASQSGNYEGYGFAIPINLAKKILDDFREYGEVKRGYLGVTFPSPDAEDQILKEKGITPGSYQGVYISGVQPGGAAEAAGLKEGDIITSVNGVVLKTSADLQERIGRLRPGDRVAIQYSRGGSVKTANVTLKGDEAAKLAARNVAGVSSAKLGASFTPLTAAQKNKFRITSGVVVSNVSSGGLFDRYDIPKGMIITNINGQEVNSTADVNAAIATTKDGMMRVNGVGPDGSRFSFSFPAR